MVVIRLTRKGAKKKPFYQVIAVDRQKPRESKYLELLGHYDPKARPAVIRIDLNKYEKWIGKGAQPSVTVKSLIKKIRSNSN